MLQRTTVLLLGESPLRSEDLFSVLYPDGLCPHPVETDSTPGTRMRLKCIRVTTCQQVSFYLLDTATVTNSKNILLRMVFMAASAVPLNLTVFGRSAE